MTKWCDTFLLIYSGSSISSSSISHVNNSSNSSVVIWWWLWDNFYCWERAPSSRLTEEYLFFLRQAGWMKPIKVRHYEAKVFGHFYLLIYFYGLDCFSFLWPETSTFDKLQFFDHNAQWGIYRGHKDKSR